MHAVSCNVMWFMYVSRPVISVHTVYLFNGSVEMVPVLCLFSLLYFYDFLDCLHPNPY